MVLSDENNPAVAKATNPPQGGLEVSSRKFGQQINRPNRRALGVINQNTVETQGFPRALNKRGLSEKQIICDNNPQLQRPITRKYAAQMASKQQKPTETSAFGDCIFVDVEEEKPNVETIEPMFDEQTEERLIEADLMEEVEMEDIVDESIMDIDGCDAKNSLAVVEYVEDLYAHYRKIESLSCVLSNYMTEQSDINERMRAILIDWIIEVHDKFELSNETLYLTVNLIDRFLARQTIPRKKLQLVGLVAMLLACKYEEVFVPVVDDLILISDKAYDRKEVIEMERLMLNKLHFNMSVPTPYVFMKRFIKAAQSDKKIELLSLFLMELSLVEYEMLKFQPSLLAATAVYTSQCTLYGSKQWNKTSEWHSTYSEQQLLECSRMMASLHQKAGKGKLTGVYRKYSTSKYGYTAKCEVAHVLLEET